MDVGVDVDVDVKDGDGDQLYRIRDDQSNGSWLGDAGDPALPLSSDLEGFSPIGECLCVCVCVHMKLQIAFRRFRFVFFCFYFLFCFFAVRFTYLKNWVCWRHRLVADAGMDGREGWLLTEKGKWGP